MNSSIDLADDLISQCRFKIPLDYKETFEILGREKVLDEATLKKLKQLVYYRNLISHEYYRIGKEELLKLIKATAILPGYLAQVKKFIEKNSA